MALLLLHKLNRLSGNTVTCLQSLLRQTQEFGRAYYVSIQGTYLTRAVDVRNLTSRIADVLNPSDSVSSTPQASTVWISNIPKGYLSRLEGRFITFQFHRDATSTNGETHLENCSSVLVSKERITGMVPRWNTKKQIKGIIHKRQSHHLEDLI